LIAADGKTLLSSREIFLILDRVLKEVKLDLKQQGREEDFVGAKVNYL
jgi:adenosine deaminase CECR1